MTPQDPITRYIRPLIMVFVFVGCVLSALQFWIAATFVTRDELEHLRVTLEQNHAAHMDDYRRTREGVDELKRILEHTPRPKLYEDDE